MEIMFAFRVVQPPFRICPHHGLVVEKAHNIQLDVFTLTGAIGDVDEGSCMGFLRRCLNAVRPAAGDQVPVYRDKKSKSSPSSFPVPRNFSNIEVFSGKPLDIRGYL